MDNDLNLNSTYKLPLILKREDILLTGGFCLCKESLDALKSTCQRFLHPDEMNHFNYLHYPKRQHSFLLGRYSAKQAISAFLNLNDLKLICIENGVFQHPIMNHPKHNNIQVSISHTNILGAALAFPEAHPMAIDIETICPDKISVLETRLTAAEQILIEKFFASKIAQLTILWTIKEALSKVLRCGFTIPFEILEIETINLREQMIISHFKNFYQYQTLSFLLADTACSLVYPRKTSLDFDIKEIQQLFNGGHNV